MRCFIAINVPEHVRDRLAMLLSDLKSCNWPIRWMKPEQIHLTVKFLGDVPDADVADVCSAVKDIAAQTSPFALTIGTAGCFPPRGQVRTLWTDVLEPPPELATLQQQLESAMEAFGIAREARPFRPHLTLGRAKGHGAGGHFRELLGEHASFNAGSFDVDEIVLYQSELTPKGPIHTPLVRAPLSGPPEPPVNADEPFSNF